MENVKKVVFYGVYNVEMIIFAVEIKEFRYG